jgi:hypothetical protein
LIDPEELAICRRRGHTTIGIVMSEKWSKCKWCGTWLREVRTIEEREDEPPIDEQSVFGRTGNN